MLPDSTGKGSVKSRSLKEEDADVGFLFSELQEGDSDDIILRLVGLPSLYTFSQARGGYCPSRALHPWLSL